MYNEFFGFEKNPFASRPDLAFFYRSKNHETSLRSLLFAVQARMGLSSLTGEEGTGKTLLLESLRDSLESNNVHCAFLRDSRITTTRFFETIASELDLRCQGTSAYHVFSALHKFSTQQAKKGRTVALIVDDAHNLPADVFNEILHLASLHDDKVKLLQTVLAGRPELHSTLDNLNLDRLQQHAILSCTLQPFTAQETEEYIAFRLAAAGMPEQAVFSPEAIREVYDRSRGYATAIHALCEGLLLAAFSASSPVCDRDILDQVFKNSRAEKSEIEEIAGSVVPLLAAPEPEPPAMLTEVLHLAFIAMRSMPPPLPANAEISWEPQRTALRMAFPHWAFALPATEMVAGSEKMLRLVDRTQASSGVSRSVHQADFELQRTGLFLALPHGTFVRPAVGMPAGSNKLVPLADGKPAADTIRFAQSEISSIPSTPDVSKPVLSAPVVLVEPRREHKLRRLRPNKSVSSGRSSVDHAAAIEFPSVVQGAPTANFQTIGAERVSLVRLPAKYAPPAVATGLRNILQTAIDFSGALPCHPRVSFGGTSGAFEPRFSNQLYPLACSLTAVPALSGVPAGTLSSSIPSTLEPLYPTANFQTIGADRVSLVRLPSRPEPPAVASGLRNIIHTAVDFTGSFPCHPGTSAGEGSQDIAPRVSNQLFLLAFNRMPTSPIPAVPTGAHSSSTPSALPPMHPAARLQPAGPSRLAQVRNTPFGIAQSDPPLPRASESLRNRPWSLRSPSRPALTRELLVSRESNLRERNLLPLVYHVPPRLPRPEMPVPAYWNVLPSLRPLCPVSILQPVDPRHSLLLLSAPPRESTIATRNASTFNRKWLVTIVAPILGGLALYASRPAINSAVEVAQQSWHGAHQMVLDRATVALDEDFRAGLDDWMSHGGARPSWISDAAGFVHPASLALYRPSLSLSDYQMQFVGTIDKKALSWVVRAEDFKNYYSIQLAILKPGPIPTVGVIRYAVVNGKTQDRVVTPLLIRTQLDTVYRVSLDVRGDRFTLSVQDQQVDTWTESKLPRGGVGFYSDPDAGSRVTALRVKGQDDALGRLCAMLAPAGVSSYRASLSERAALNLTSEGTGRGPSSGYVGRLPRGRLDPTFWQVPEVALPNARRCAPPTGRAGTVRSKHAPNTGNSTTCY
jgi:general secretion pathway protein A